MAAHRYWLATLAVIVVAAFVHGPAVAADEGLAAWAKVNEVFSHPRCANCHVGADNLPIWSGPHYGSQPRPHGMHVDAGASRIGAENGLLCMSCHGPRNAEANHGPPGAHAWLLAPVSMQWSGRSSAEICAQIKDPQRNGGRALAEIADHVEHDALVGWGWAPGGDREAAPYSAVQAAGFLREWAGHGAPCPSR